MTILIITIHVIVCFILILVILLQAGRGSGLSWGSFGGSPQSFLGTKSASFLAKATSVSAIVFLLTCISLNIMEARKARSLFTGAKPNQVDVNKIKEVLDKLKAEQTQKAGQPSAPANATKVAATTPTTASPENTQTAAAANTQTTTPK